MAVASFSRTMCPATLHTRVKEHDKGFKVLSWPSDCPDLSPMEQLWMCWTHRSDPWRLHLAFSQPYRDLLLRVWCQTPQDTFRGSKESIPRWDRAVLEQQYIRLVIMMFWLLSVNVCCFYWSGTTDWYPNWCEITPLILTFPNSPLHHPLLHPSLLSNWQKPLFDWRLTSYLSLM